MNDMWDQTVSVLLASNRSADLASMGTSNSLQEQTEQGMVESGVWYMHCAQLHGTQAPWAEHQLLPSWL
jgi:hypothetical protein